MQLSKNFTLEEMVASDVAKEKHIRNTPDTQAIINLTALCVAVLQPLRSWWENPIHISSGYRSKRLNKAVGGVSNSQHMSGQAADISIGGDMAQGWLLFSFIRDRLTFDQLIWEHDRNGTYWIHVSYNTLGNRRQVIDSLLK